MYKMSTQQRIEFLERFDPEIADLLRNEEIKQRKTIGLIASENIASDLSICLEGSIFTNKNTEGYPGKRYVGGTENQDKIELLAIQRLKELFGCGHANLQSGNATIANLSVLIGLLNIGDTILSMSLNDGGHLSHGAKFNLSGKLYHVIQYGVRREDERIDMEQVRLLALEHRPKIIACGGSAYPRLIDYKAFREIADEVGAYLWVDAAHVVGMIAGKAIPSPVPYADVVTFSTQKTLRGPRGCGVILCREELKEKIDRGVFPGIQGGPKADMIAARAVLFKECMTKEYQNYQKQVLYNAKALAEGCMEEGLELVSGGTDNHLMLVKVTDYIASGRDAELLLESVGIVTNKNLIPYDTLNSNLTSGIRIGSPLMTTRGAKEDEMRKIGRLIGKTLKNKNVESALDEIRWEVDRITDKYPMFAEEWIV